MKFHDIPSVVAKSAAKAAEIGVDMFTIHLAGGRAMFEAVREAVEGGITRPDILGVSVLTSFDKKTWAKVSGLIGGKSTIASSMNRLVGEAAKWGIDGAVCSFHELVSIRKKHPNLKTVVPGIRPKTSDKDDQSRTATPLEAAIAGASIIVVGRPITQSHDPKHAVLEILREIKA